VQAESEELGGLGQQSRERLAVGVVDEDEDATCSAGGHVVVAVGEVEAGAARHGTTDGRAPAGGRPGFVTLSAQGLSLMPVG
jgi:hypothetical protein